MLSAITKYFESCILLDDKVIWEYVEREEKMKEQPGNQEETQAEKLAIVEQVAEQFQKS